MTKGCQKRATEVCYSCKEVRLCLTHKMSICSQCDVPSSTVSVAAPVLEPEPEPVAEPVSASAAAAPIPIAESKVLPLDDPMQCFFPVGTTTLSLAWIPKKPCLKKDPGSDECPGVEAFHGDFELPEPNPTTHALVRCDAGSILAPRHGR